MSKQLRDHETDKRLSGATRVALEIASFREQAKLDSWNSFVEELQVPSEIYPALVTSRPELLAAVQPRDLPANEVGVLYKLIGGLLETNAALREHTERVAQLTGILNDSLKGFASAARSIHDFANFRTVADSEDEHAAA